MSDDASFKIELLRRLNSLEQAVDRVVEAHISLAAEVNYRNSLLESVVEDFRAMIRHDQDEWWKSGDEPPEFDE